MKDVTITPKNGIDNIDEINERMKLLIGKEIKFNNNQYTIPKEVFIGKQIYDEVRYYLKVNSKGEIEYSEYIGESIKNETLLKRYNCYEKILIIVESPHKDEFTFNYEPIGPAQGKTGYGIEFKIKEVIKKFSIASAECILIISNPVQFQASLATFYSKIMCSEIRNNLWTTLYKENIYLSKLNEIKAKYILNATTDGRKLRIKKVLEKHKEQMQIKPIIKTSNHPSEWIRKGIVWRE